MTKSTQSLRSGHRHRSLFFWLISTSLTIFSNCATPMEIAHKAVSSTPFEKYCPTFGSLSAKELAPVIYTTEAGRQFIALKSQEGNILDIPITQATEAPKISSEAEFHAYMENYRSLCGSDKPPFYEDIVFAQYLRFPDKWKALQKDKPSVVYAFHGQIPAAPESNKLLQSEVWAFFTGMIDQRVDRYLRAHFPEQAALAGEHIWYVGETEDTGYTLRELFYTALLGRNPNSDFKIESSQFYLDGTSEKFKLHLKLPGEDEATIAFEKTNKRLYVTGLQVGFYRNPPRWQYAVFRMFQTFAALPAKDHWDWPAIDAL